MSGSECCSNPPVLNPSGGVGHVEKFGGLNSYLIGSPDSNLALLLVSDVYGYEAPNLRNLADKIAAAGYYVIVPDFFHADPFDPENADRPLPVWLKDHGTDKGFEDAKSIIDALKSKGASAVGAAGFCWGAKVVVELAKPRLIQAAVLLHPSFVSVDDINGFDIPISVLGAEIDKYSPPELVKQFEQILAAKPGVDYFVKIFPKVSHGWSVRNLADKVAAAGYYVVVPDFFHGDPYNPKDADRPLPVWLKDHGTHKGFEDAKSIIDALKSQGVLSIGAAGFCWGAKVVVELAKPRLIQAAVLLHPSFVSVDDIKGVDIPISVLGAEIDKLSPPELVKQFEQVLAAKPGVDYCVKILPKVSHGWSVRYITEDAEAVKAAEEAHQDLLNWFAKHLE